LRSVVTELQRRVAAEVKLPGGYHIEFGGQFESEAEATRRLLWLGLAVLAGILLLLRSAFDSLRDALVILLNLPLALVGGVAGVWWSGGVLSVASMIGFITLFGIATRNGIMLVGHIRHLEAMEGVGDRAEAIRRGAMERLSPILMTALAAALALIPIALGQGQAGSEIQSPMAMVILCGLASSTALNMVVVPVACQLWGRRQERA
jgi:Cu/Ag efflux pump CusA